MQKNKNGILVQSPGKKRKRRIPPDVPELGKRKYYQYVNGVEVVVVVPHFSPIVEIMSENGWRKLS